MVMDTSLMGTMDTRGTRARDTANTSRMATGTK